MKGAGAEYGAIEFMDATEEETFTNYILLETTGHNRNILGHSCRIASETISVIYRRQNSDKLYIFRK